MKAEKKNSQQQHKTAATEVEWKIAKSIDTQHKPTNQQTQNRKNRTKNLTSKVYSSSSSSSGGNQNSKKATEKNAEKLMANKWSQKF